MASPATLRKALAALVEAAGRVEWSAYQFENDMPLCIECGEGHPEHNAGGGHKLDCPLGITLRRARAALADATDEGRAPDKCMICDEYAEVFKLCILHAPDPLGLRAAPASPEPRHPGLLPGGERDPVWIAWHDLIQYGEHQDEEARLESAQKIHQGLRQRTRTLLAALDAASPEPREPERSNDPAGGDECTKAFRRGIRFAFTYPDDPKCKAILAQVEAEAGIEPPCDACEKEASSPLISRPAVEHDCSRAASPEPEGERCTGLSATWCPVHGDCKCEGEDRASYLCPLHSPTSSHGPASPPSPVPLPRNVYGKCRDCGATVTVCETVDIVRCAACRAESAAPSPAPEAAPCPTCNDPACPACGTCGGSGVGNPDGGDCLACDGTGMRALAPLSPEPREGTKP